MHRHAPLAALLFLAACAESEEASLVPPREDEGYNVVRPVSAQLGDDRELTIGEWGRSMQEEQPALLFGPASTEALFSMRCQGREALLLQRHGTIATGGTQQMTIGIGGASQKVAVSQTPGPLPMLRAEVPIAAELVRGLAGAQEPIRVSVDDGPPLVMPPSPLIAEYVAGCATAAVAAPVAEGPANGSETVPLPANGAAANSN